MTDSDWLSLLAFGSLAVLFAVTNYFNGKLIAAQRQYIAELEKCLPPHLKARP